MAVNKRLPGFYISVADKAPYRLHKPAYLTAYEKYPYCLVKFSKVFVGVFIVFFVCDCILSGAAAFRMDRRDAGIPASNAVSEYLDNHFDDERMHKIYANSKDVVK